MHVGSAFGAIAQPTKVLSHAKVRSTGRQSATSPKPCSTPQRAMTG